MLVSLINGSFFSLKKLPNYDIRTIINLNIYGTLYLFHCQKMLFSHMIMTHMQGVEKRKPFSFWMKMRNFIRFVSRFFFVVTFCVAFIFSKACFSRLFSSLSRHLAFAEVPTPTRLDPHFYVFCMCVRVGVQWILLLAALFVFAFCVCLLCFVVFCFVLFLFHFVLFTSNPFCLHSTLPHSFVVQ